MGQYQESIILTYSDTMNNKYLDRFGFPHPKISAQHTVAYYKI